jgi:hypothetical protein
MTTGVHDAAGDDPLARGFYFIVVVWGERFCDYFLEYCLPSLLSPGNIPALRTRSPSKFLIATRPEDWELMRATVIFREMERYVTPVFFEIPLCPPGRSGCEHMGIGHKLCCELAFREKGYAMILTPDCMLSEGSIGHLQELAKRGAKVVLAAALRFGEEPFLGKLQEIGAIPRESRRDSGKSLVIDGRTMASAAIQGFHSETLRFEWDSPYFFARLPSAVWWRVPEEDGIVLHSLSWAPLLFDYESVRAHDTSMLDNWTIDGDYVYKNYGDSSEVQIVSDSDDAFIASWGPLSDRPQSLTPIKLFQVPYLGNLIKGVIFYEAFYGPVFDPVKRRIFYRPVYWHSRPLNDQWKVVEARAADVFSIALKRPDSATMLAIVDALRMPLRLAIVLAHFWASRYFIKRRINQILHGDAAATKRVAYRLFEFGAFIVGRGRL